MDILTLIFSLALIVGVLWLILYPLWSSLSGSETTFENDHHPGQTLEEYQARYQATLDSIRDLMFDHEMGKTSVEDYEKLLTKAKLEAAEIRRQIDRLNHTVNVYTEAALDVEIEKLIAELRLNRFEGHETLLPEVDSEIEHLKHTADLDELMICPHCGKAFLPGDTFCIGCGQSLAELTADEAALFQDVCPACGYVIQPDDLFCARCGTAIHHQPPPQNRPEVIIE